MLAKSPTDTKPATTFVYAGRYAVRLAASLKCPHCTRPLHASDVEVDFGAVRIVCQGCHCDVLIVGATS